MTLTKYRIEVIQAGSTSWLEPIQAAIDDELRRIGLHRSVSVQVGTAHEPSEAPGVALYVGSEEASTSPEVRAQVRQALDRGSLVVPLVSDLGRFAELVPDILRPLNGLRVSLDSPNRLALFLLEELGIEEKQRKVFISHKREDGLGAAEQLHDKLTHHGFLPFIDRFAIREGQDVQNEIADALENYAFLLLLETPQAHTSDWVFDEVEYALSHTMGSLIVSWPGDPRPVPGSNRLPRLKLAPSDLRTDDHNFEVFTDIAIDKIVAETEAAHAEGLVRRRKMLVRSIEDAVVAAGLTSTPLPDWRVLVEEGDETTLVGTTPRLPTATDLQLLDQARSGGDMGESAVLVHSARVLGEKLRNHLTWTVGERSIETIPEHAIGAKWDRT